MRIFSTRVHGVLDYLMAAVLIAAPWLLGPPFAGAAAWVPMAVGAGVLVYSLATHYELGAVHVLQIPVHLWLDALAGIVLAISPWVFEFDERVWIPHLVLGLLWIGVAFLSDTIPGYERRSEARAAAE